MALEREFEAYKQKLPDLLVHEGKFVLIHGDEVGGLYSAYEDAIGAGYEKFGLEPFLVKEILAAERVQYFTRPINACHT